MESSASKHQDGEESTSDSPDHPQVTLSFPLSHFFNSSFCSFNSITRFFFCLDLVKVYYLEEEEEKSEEISLVHQQSRKPNLSSLQIPARSLEASLHDFIPSIQTPTSSSSSPSCTSTTRGGGGGGGLPPRPNSAKFKSSVVRNLLPQRSLNVKPKNLSQDANTEKTVLIVPDTPSSDAGPPSQLQNKPTTTSRSFSLNKLLCPTSSSKPAPHSLPATPIANSGPESVRESHLTTHSVSYPLFSFCHYSSPGILFIIRTSFLGARY